MLRKALAKLIPIVSSPEGILLGELGRADGRVLVLADPDILATHGLGKGDNANLAFRIIDNLRDEGLLSPQALWRLPREELEELIRPAGYFRLKSGRLRNQ